MMIYGKDDLRNITSCLKPWDNSLSVSNLAYKWLRHGPGSWRVSPTRWRVACRLRQSHWVAGGLGLLPEHHLSQFVLILPNIPTAVPPFESAERPLFPGARELFSNNGLYLSKTTRRSRLCLLTTGNCPRLSWTREKWEEAGDGPGAFWWTTEWAQNPILWTIYIVHVVVII